MITRAFVVRAFVVRSSQFGALLDEAVGSLGRLMAGTHPGSVPFGS